MGTWIFDIPHLDFWQKMKNLPRKLKFFCHKSRCRISKIHVLNGIKCITSYYELVMHHWSSRKHGIQRYLIIVGRQNLKTWSISMKKVKKVTKMNFFTCDMVYYGCACIIIIQVRNPLGTYSTSATLNCFNFWCLKLFS